jgi:thioredoxin-related transmembrane protein 2
MIRLFVDCFDLMFDSVDLCDSLSVVSMSAIRSPFELTKSWTKKKKIVMLLGRFVKPYYILNVLILASHFAVRRYVGTDALGKGDVTGMTREAQIIFCLLLLLAVKYVSSPTIDAWLSTCFLVSDVALLVLWFAVDWRVSAWYAVLVAFTFVAFPQPLYTGPQNIEYLSEAQFEQVVLLEHVVGKQRTAKKRKKKKQDGDRNDDDAIMSQIWLVEFYTSWSPLCKQLAPLIAELSLRYGGGAGSVRFAKVDVQRYPNVATKLRIDTASTSIQLPSLIMFRRGKELQRLPVIHAASGVVVRAKFTRKQIEQHFDLNK